MTDVTHEIRYRAQGPTLAAYIADRTRRAFLDGPLGSGKTNASCYKAFRVMVDEEPNSHGMRLTRLAAIRNTYPDLMTTSVNDWMDSYGDLGNFVGGGREPPRHTLKFHLEDGSSVESELYFIALDRPDDVRKLRGLPLTAAWVNEFKELARATVDMTDLRVGRYWPDGRKPRWHGLFGDSNKPDTDHWYYELAEEMRPDGYAFFHQPGAVLRDGFEDGRVRWKLNPNAENLRNLVPGYYSEGMQGKRDDWIAVNFANEYGYVREGKPVYEEYRDATHCRAFDLDRRLPLHIGLDFGHTPAATIGQRTHTGQWRTRWEVVTEQMGGTNFARVLKRFINEKCATFKIAAIIGDPSGEAPGEDENESTVFEILAANGIVAEPARTNEYSVRRDAVANCMTRMVEGEPGYLVHPDCKVLRKAHQGAYCFRRLQVAGMERFRDAPDKSKWSHVAEAEQYMMLGGGEGKAVIRRDESLRPRARVAIVDYPIFG
jgi:hypothetical protein